MAAPLAWCTDTPLVSTTLSPYIPLTQIWQHQSSRLLISSLMDDQSFDDLNALSSLSLVPLLGVGRIPQSKCSSWIRPQ
ncbi:MAG: hypothetical protein LKE37_05110 [Atopobiaceae bacterium]|nr:hypothetical protein [Atopobiaceae bacterium]